jgi:hypothetical protein
MTTTDILNRRGPLHPPPPPHPFSRSSIDLCFALDVSESMSKQFPGYAFTLLEMALRQIYFTLKKLSSKDRIALVLFCSEQREVFPLTTCTEANKHIFMQLLSSITCKKSTWSCLGRGLAAALSSLASSTEPSSPTSMKAQDRCKRVVYLSNFYFSVPFDITPNENQFTTLIANALYGHITPPHLIPAPQQQLLPSRSGGRVTQDVLERITKKTYSPQNAIYVSVVSVGNGMLSLNCRQEICQIIGAKYYSFQNEMILENLISHEMVPVASNISLIFPSNVTIKNVYGSTEFTSLNPIYMSGGDSEGRRRNNSREDFLNEIVISSEFPSPTPNILMITLQLLDWECENKRKVPQSDRSKAMKSNDPGSNLSRKRLRFEDDEPSELSRFNQDVEEEEEGSQEGYGEEINTAIPPIPLRVEWRDRNGRLCTHNFPLAISSPLPSLSSRNTNTLRSFTNILDIPFGASRGHDHTTSPSSSTSHDEFDHSSICPPAVAASPLSLPPGISSPKITPVSEAHLLIDFVNCVQYYISCISTDLINKLLNNDFNEAAGEMFISDTVIKSLRHLKRSGSLYSIPSLHVTGLMPTQHGSSLPDSLLFYHIILMKLIRCQKALAGSLLTSPSHPSQPLNGNLLTPTAPSSGAVPVILQSSSLPTSSSSPSSCGYRYLYDLLHQIITLEKTEYEKCLSQLMTSAEKKKFEELCPKQYLCPISLTVMKHPVIAHDGYSYEEENILKWFRTGHLTSPVTNSMISSTQVIMNYTLKGLIDEFMENFYDTYLDSATPVPAVVHTATSLSDGTPPQSSLSSTDPLNHLPSRVHTPIFNGNLSKHSLEDSTLTTPLVISSVPLSQFLISSNPSTTEPK